MTITIPDWIVRLAGLAIIGVVIAGAVWTACYWPNFRDLAEFSRVMNKP